MGAPRDVSAPNFPALENLPRSGPCPPGSEQAVMIRPRRGADGCEPRPISDAVRLANSAAKRYGEGEKFKIVPEQLLWVCQKRSRIRVAIVRLF